MLAIWRAEEDIKDRDVSQLCYKQGFMGGGGGGGGGVYKLKSFIAY